MNRRRIFLALALFASEAGAQLINIPPVRTVATLGSASQRRLAIVTDGASATDCATGSGSTTVLCISNGTSWASVASAGLSTNSFETLNAPTGTDPVADSGTDTLNLTCGTGLTCTGTSGTDTLDLTPSESGLESLLDLQDLQGAVTDAQVPDSITVSLAATATALAANGANCSSGNYPLGVDASGASETCTADDDVPESGDFGAIGLTGDVTSSGLVTTIAADSVAMGTDTTGNYVSSATTSQGLLLTGTEGASLGLIDCAATEVLKRNAGDTAWECASDSGGVTDHGALTGLSDDDHTQYALLAGRSGGQTLTGGTGSGEGLSIVTTSNATKGSIQIDSGVRLLNMSGNLWVKNAANDDFAQVHLQQADFKGPSPYYRLIYVTAYPGYEAVALASGVPLGWSASSTAAGTETCIVRDAAGRLRISDCSSGTEDLKAAVYISAPQTQTIADNGGGTAASATLTPTSSVARITCSDANGCDVTLSETGAVDGQQLQILNDSTNAVNLADSAGVSELAGAAALGQYDSIALVYSSDRWIELSRSNN